MKSKGFLLATAATGAALAPNAMAADLKAPAPVVVPPATSWSGWYVGLHAGAAWHQAHTASVYTGTPLDAATGHGTGFIGGGQIGYNWQRGNFVVGVEADGSWLSAKARVTNETPSGTYGLEGKIRWLSTVRARFGLVVGDTMAYATGGVAFGGVRNSLLFGICSTPECLAQSQSKTRIGWTVGGGVEHMWNRNWSIALEGLFVDLGRSRVGGIPVGPNPAFTKTTTFSNQVVVGRLKLNYKW
jgi:outer membrane immunogenic protein